MNEPWFFDSHSHYDSRRFQEDHLQLLDTMAECAKADGCTKTNPIIPTIEEFKALFVKAYNG